MVKASDISDEMILQAHQRCKGRHGVSHWSTLGDIQEELAAFPPKVVLAKLKSVVRRKLLNGCTCGCRGDFSV